MALLKIRHHNLDWWLWLTTGVFIGGNLFADWKQAYNVVTIVSVFHLLLYILRDGSLVSFPVQVRWVFLGLVLIGTRQRWLQSILLGGMVLVVFFDRCGIGKVLVRMPWNKGVSTKAN